MRQVGTEILYFPGPPLLLREIVSRDAPIKTKIKSQLMNGPRAAGPSLMDELF